MTGQPVGEVAVKAFLVARSEARLLVPALMFIALVVAAVASLGTPLITSVATSFHVSLGSAQWTLTVALLSGAVATPVLGRLGAGPHRRATIPRHAGGRRRRQRAHRAAAAVRVAAGRQGGPGRRARADGADDGRGPGPPPRGAARP
ncbi:hypothetical protein O1M63_05940 [Streptomyces mirabilis]|nr:hypothetical protein [Streptomyces mirabilis]